MALSGLVLLWRAAVLGATIAAVLFEMTLGNATPEEMADGVLTPALLLADNVGIALAVPLALVIHRIVFGQTSGWLFSVQGRFRWRALRGFLLVAAAVHVVVLAAWLAANGAPDALRFRPQTSYLLAASC